MTLKGEIYSNYWNMQKVEKVSIWRNPHIACEWINAKVVDNDNTRKWFKYQQTGIVTDIYGTLALRLGTMDFDGDTVASVHSDIIYNAVERADIHTIRFVPYAEDSTGGKSKEEFHINDYRKIMYTNKLGFQNNIGDVTNKVTVLWALYGSTTDAEQRKKISDYIKVMSVINQLIIDFVKTGVKVPIPKDILSVVEKAKKPAFMQNKKGRWVNDKKVISNAKKFDYIVNEMADKKQISVDEIISDQKKYEFTNGTGDRLYKYLLKSMADIKIKFESSSEICRFTKLLKEIPYVYNATYPKVKERLRELVQIHNTICGKKYYDEKVNSCIDDSTWRFEPFYAYCEEELLKECSDRKTLLNYLVYIFYTDDEFYNCDKAILWNVFGQDICYRYMNRDICTDEILLKKLAKKENRAEKNAEKVKKMISSANIISIKGLPEESVVITDAELNYITKTIPDNAEAQRLMISLLALYKKINIGIDEEKSKAIKISKGKKNEITEYQLCKLSDIHLNQFHNRLKILHEKGLISIDMSNLKVPKIKVHIPKLCEEGKEYKIIDINDVGTILSECKLA